MLKEFDCPGRVLHGKYTWMSCLRHEDKTLDQVYWPGNHILCALPKHFHAYGVMKILTDALGTLSRAETQLDKTSTSRVELSSMFRFRARGLELE
jgi:hypothetical protein